MLFRGAVIAVVLGGCYSPSLDTCALTCAANDVCPNGFECSNGRCAVEGTTCSTMLDGGTDGMDGNRVCAGGICFKPPVQFDLMESGIYDAQFARVVGDSAPDLVFLTDTNFIARTNVGGVLDTTNVVGPSVASASARRMLATSLDGNSLSELVVNNASSIRLEVHQYSGTSWSVVESIETRPKAALGLAAGKVAAMNAPVAIAVLFDDGLDVFQLAASSVISLSRAMGTASLVNARDLVIGDFDDNNIREIAVAHESGIAIFRALNSMISPMSNPPNINVPVDALANCDIDGDDDNDIVYSIGGANTVGVTMFNPVSTGFDLPTPTTIPGHINVLDCVDLDADGKGDVITAAREGQNVDLLVLRGKTDGTLEAPLRFRLPSTFVHIHAKEDFNGDGRPDIVLTSAMMGLITILESSP